MIAGDLGDEEILLLCCDDGNVSAFHTRAISNEVKRREDDTASFGLGSHEIRAFFSQSVPRSAWGLAIHTSARMIAVSCNAPEHPGPTAFAEITVFAFCLIDPGCRSQTEESLQAEDYAFSDTNEWKPYNDMGSFPGSVGAAERYRHNIKVVLQGHRQNIPSVAFFNSDRDSEGRWLISTDINGQTRVWDIWYSKGSCIAKYENRSGEWDRPSL